jgi:hypothetical protein
MSWNLCGTPVATKIVEPGSTGRSLVPDRDPPPAGDHVVDLVLAVRPLEIRLADTQHVQPDRQVRDGDELEIRPARRGLSGDEIGQLERIHAPRIASDRTGSVTSRDRVEPRRPGARRIRRWQPG